MKVYLLWSNDEYGPIDLKATLDRDKVVGIAKSLDVDDWFKRVGCEDLPERLQAIMLSNPPDDIYNLMGGWGGLHLQVVELD